MTRRSTPPSLALTWMHAPLALQAARARALAVPPEAPGLLRAPPETPGLPPAPLRAAAVPVPHLGLRQPLVTGRTARAMKRPRQVPWMTAVAVRSRLSLTAALARRVRGSQPRARRPRIGCALAAGPAARRPTRLPLAPRHRTASALSVPSARQELLKSCRAPLTRTGSARCVTPARLGSLRTQRVRHRNHVSAARAPTVLPWVSTSLRRARARRTLSVRCAMATRP
mmetsp:Transcript_135805/g.330122  ORF Transcript_135805/g.330122 Transcript_135805/m.330122 type:complete len:227 (-) Transcript_135805:3139-3819(-)